MGGAVAKLDLLPLRHQLSRRYRFIKSLLSDKCLNKTDPFTCRKLPKSKQFWPLLACAEWWINTRAVPKIMSLASVIFKCTYCGRFTFLCPSKYSPPARMHPFRRSIQFWKQTFIVLNRHTHEELIYTRPKEHFLTYKYLFPDGWNLGLGNKR